MSKRHHCSVGPLSKTPPTTELAPWPLTPPNSEKRIAVPTVRSVRDLRTYWAAGCFDFDTAGSAVIPVAQSFDCTRYLDKVDFLRRIDCYPTCLRVRMPSATHESFSRGIESAFTTQKNARVDDAFSAIGLDGSSPIVFKRRRGQDKRESRQPDIQIAHASQSTPAIVIEVAYTQTEKSLQRLAYDYILNTKGNIRKVYGIKLQSGQPSTVTEWQARFAPSRDAAFSQELHVDKTFSLEFRAADGSLMNENRALTISPRDFDVEAQAQEDVPIRISFRTLFELLASAEQRERVRKRGQDESEEDSQPAKRLRLFDLDSSLEEEPEPEPESDEGTARCKDGDYEP